MGSGIYNAGMQGGSGCGVIMGLPWQRMRLSAILHDLMHLVLWITISSCLSKNSFKSQIAAHGIQTSISSCDQNLDAGNLETFQFLLQMVLCRPLSHLARLLLMQEGLYGGLYRDIMGFY